MSSDNLYISMEPAEAARLRIPICRIKYLLNDALVRAAKYKKLKKSKKRKKSKNPRKKKVVKKCAEQHHWNTNLLHGRATRSSAKILANAQYELRLRYFCMPLLGDEHLLDPPWDIHLYSIAVEYASSP